MTPFTREEILSSYALAVMSITGACFQFLLLFTLIGSGTCSKSRISNRNRIRNNRALTLVDGHFLVHFILFLSVLGITILTAYVTIKNLTGGQWIVGKAECASIGAANLFLLCMAFFMIAAASTERFVSIIDIQSNYDDFMSLSPTYRKKSGLSAAKRKSRSVPPVMKSFFSTPAVGNISLYWILIIVLSLLISFVIALLLPVIYFPGDKIYDFYNITNRLNCGPHYFQANASNSSPSSFIMAIIILVVIAGNLLFIFVINVLTVKALRKMIKLTRKEHTDLSIFAQIQTAPIDNPDSRVVAASLSSSMHLNNNNNTLAPAIGSDSSTVKGTLENIQMESVSVSDISRVKFQEENADRASSELNLFSNQSLNLPSPNNKATSIPSYSASSAAASGVVMFTDDELKVYFRIVSVTIALFLQWIPYSVILLYQLIVSFQSGESGSDSESGISLELVSNFIVLFGYDLQGIIPLLTDNRWIQRFKFILSKY